MTTFFSKTIYFYNIPKVTIEIGKIDSLKKEFEIKGVVEWDEIKNISPKISGEIEKVFIQKNNTIKIGDKLLQFNCDNREFYNQIEAINYNIKKLNLEIEKINKNINTINLEIKNINEKNYSNDNSHDFDFEIKKLELEIDIAKENLEKKIVLFNNGVISESELISCKSQLVELELKKDEIYKNINNFNKEESENNIKFNQEKEDSLKNLKNSIYDYEYELQLNEVEKNYLNIQIEEIQNKIEETEKNSILYSNYNGKVLDVNFVENEIVNTTDVFITVAKNNSSNIICDLKDKEIFSFENAVCFINFENNKVIIDTNKIIKKDNDKIHIENENYKIGTKLTLNFIEEIGENDLTLSNSCINKDNDGDFVYIVKKRDGILGEEYFVQKSNVTLGNSNNSRTIINKGLNDTDVVISYSNKFIKSEDIIEIENIGDLY